MNTLVVDTDVISYLLKQDSRAESYRHILEDTFRLISFMTLAELEQ